MDGPSAALHSLHAHHRAVVVDDLNRLIVPAPVVEDETTRLRGNLEIRTDEVQVLADGRRVGLTVREFQVLLVLAERNDHVVHRTEIYGRVWGGAMKRRDRSVDVFVRKVRNKLARVSPDWSYIHTHFGVGYRFAAIPSEEENPGEDIAPHRSGADRVRATDRVREMNTGAWRARGMEERPEQGVART
ncbi:MAG TPA: winged helix-turn-helix domain-containing protein [Solirubrobacteraceae bacterium]|nr:winged helix-turn-helix domain-containing protein [Solirubrobacteraceae bacterium]